eukprot:15364855-Ditylum_brightwellii.AAC.4
MQHYYLSEITSADGKYLAYHFNDDHPPVSLKHNSEYLWLQQQCPIHHSWKIYTGQIWKMPCKLNGWLQHNLGMWMHDSDQWKYYINKDNAILYRKVEKQWYAHSLHSTMRLHLMFQLSCTAASLPAKITPVSDVVKTQDHMKFQHVTQTATDPLLCSISPSTFDQYIATLEGWEQELIQDCDFFQDEEDIRLLLQS